MKRKIKVVAKISKDNFGLYAFEKIKNDNILIFSKESNKNEMMQKFFESSLNEINTFLKAKIKKIFVYLNNFRDIHFNSEQFEITTNINNNKKIIDNKIFNQNIEQAKKTFNKNEYSLILFQAKKFTTNYEHEKKQYLTWPLNKNADNLIVEYNATYISKKYFQFLTNFFQNFDLKIENIFTNINSIQNLINIETNTNSEKIVINIDENNSWLALINNDSTIKYKELSLNYNDMIKEFSNNFNLTETKAKKIFKVYGKILNNNEANYLIDENISAKDISQAIINLVKKNSFEILEFIKKEKIETKNFFWLGALNSVENIKMAINTFIMNKETILYNSKYKTNLSKIIREIVVGLEYVELCLESQFVKQISLIETQPILNDIFIMKKSNKIANLFKTLTLRR
ncbi:hypothetical protein [Mesomycoplasma neurolyticum]|uniref:Cell division protein FtsA n=1 Tax=Mesomycoplasma neurolyticum TaxID=2120 RepID=A0A449A4M5_9BACT|nr:hypothetical protein [Mesomycoplasma neurolyticum]VEU59240.1 Uncharacterised protein [Mesomycoplasma neurolyticum]